MRIPEHPDLDAVRATIAMARGVILFCDFDGTLVPIESHPAQCQLREEVRAILLSLSSRPDCHVAIVSGRSLADLTHRVGVPSIGYVGNHGLEMRGCGYEFHDPMGGQFHKSLSAVLSRLEAEAKRFPGAWVEDKGLTLTVHYRALDPCRHGSLRSAIESSFRDAQGHEDLVLRRGKSTVEVRPSRGGNKGTATRWIAERVDPAGEHVVICIGDDDTDEDAFVAWPEAISVCVGEPRLTNAAYRFDTPADVHGFLRSLDSWLEVKSGLGERLVRSDRSEPWSGLMGMPRPS